MNEKNQTVMTLNSEQGEAIYSILADLANFFADIQADRKENENE